MSARVLLADDDSSLRLVLSQAFAREGYAVRATSSLQALAKMVRDGEGDLVVSDVYLGDDCLFDVLPGFKAARPAMPVIVMSGQNNVMTAVSATGAGAYDYVPKPFDLYDLLDAMRKALARSPESKARALSAAAEREEKLPMIGRSPAMQEVYRVMARAAGTDMTVLLEGETGSGKESCARAIHQFSRRKNAPFVRLNLAGLSHDAAEHALFSADGEAAASEGGVLFVDGLESAPLDVQSPLERFLDRQADRGMRDGPRLICASERPLSMLALEGKFRQNLYYRLAVITIRMPPLRERIEDIGDLARALLVRAKRDGLPEKIIDASAIEVLKGHAWLGNVRELENLVRRAAALRPEPLITAREIEAELTSPQQGKAERETTLEDEFRTSLAAVFASAGGVPDDGLYDRVLESLERPLFELALQATRGNQIKAASLLGINRNTLRKKLQLLGMRKGGED
jgi:two-component system nitrogen regulation response regulator GlnG